MSLLRGVLIDGNKVKVAVRERKSAKIKLVFVSMSILVACGPGKSSSTNPVAGPVDRPRHRDSEQTQPLVAPAPRVAGKPKTDLIPRSVIFGRPERSSVQISPDGKHLSWLAPKDGVLNVWVAPVGRLDRARAITSEISRPIGEYFWAYTNKHILYLQDIADGENHLFRVDLTDDKPTDLTPYKGASAQFAGVNHRFPTRLLVNINDRNPQVFDVYEIDLLTGKRTLAAQNDDNLIAFTIDHDMKVRFATKELPDGNTALFQAETKAGKLTWKLYAPISFQYPWASGIIGFGPDGKTVYAYESGGRDREALVSVDIASKKSEVLAEDLRADAGDTIIHPTKHSVQAVAFEYDRVRWQVVDKSIAKDLAALAELDGGEVNIGGRTLDDRTWLVVTTSPQHPRRFYIWDRAKQKATFLFSSQPELDNQPLVKMHPAVIKSRDGLDLVSYLSLPAAADPDGNGKTNAPVPMVLYVHSGPWMRDSWGYNPIHQLLANRGYAVLSVNYRGSTGFGKKLQTASYFQWGKAMHDDLIDAVNWAVSSGVAPNDQVCIMGGSYGGYATLAGLTLTPDAFRCGVDILGASNLHTFVASALPSWGPAVSSIFRTRIGDPDTAAGKALLTASSPLTHIAKIKRPLLIAQGANDPLVNQAESEQIVARMTKRKLPVTYAVFSDEAYGHTVPTRPENNIAFFAVTEAFLSVHLGGFYLPITKAELEASSMQIKDGRNGIPGLVQ